MKKITIISFAIILMLLYTVPTSAQTLNFPNASAFILVDSKSGQVLYGHNIDKKLYPASVTKIMTAIVALENGNLDHMMTASQSAVNDIGDGGMNIGIMAGEELRMEDLLNALLVASANETANIIAENICPTRNDFIDLMNKKAVEIGATNTHFVTTCGIHHPDHYSTASDFAKITRYAMQIPKFREIVSKTSYNMPPTNKHSKWYPLYNTNKLLGSKSQYYSDVIGVKTGYTSQAGNNLASAAISSDGTELIAVVFGVFGPNAKYDVVNYSKELLEYGFKNYSLQTVVEKNQLISSANVENAENDTKLDLVTGEELKSVLPIDKSSFNITHSKSINSNIKAPVKKGQVLGFVTYEMNGVTLGKIDLVASADINENIKSKSIGWAKTLFESTLFKNVLIGTLIVIIMFFSLRTVLRKISRHLNSKNQEER